jgi:hypothetical protein
LRSICIRMTGGATASFLCLARDNSGGEGLLCAGGTFLTRCRLCHQRRRSQNLFAI